MGHWEVSSVSKDDPNTIVICRNHGSSEVYFAGLFLSVDERRAQWQPGGYIYLGDQSRPLEIQITNGNGQTAIVFVHYNSMNNRLIVHGHVEGGRHQYGWRELVKGKKYGNCKRRLKIEISADGMIKLMPETRFAFLLTDGSELEFQELELRIPMFAKPPTYASCAS